MGSAQWEFAHRTQQVLVEMENDIVEYKAGRITQSEMDRRYEAHVRVHNEMKADMASQFRKQNAVQEHAKAADQSGSLATS